MKGRKAGTAEHTTFRRRGLRRLGRTGCGCRLALHGPGLLIARSADAASEDAFIEALASHRHVDRETDPPLVWLTARDIQWC